MSTQAEETTHPGLLDLLAEIHITLGGIKARMEKDAADASARHRLTQQIFPLKIDLISVTNSNNTAFTAVDLPNILGPRTGWVWDIHTVIGQGIGSGQVAGYENNVNGTQWFNFTAVGQFNWGKNQFVLTPGSRLVLQSNGSVSANGAIISIRGLQISEPYYADYSI